MIFNCLTLYKAKINMENQSNYSLKIRKISKTIISIKLITEMDGNEKVIFEIESKRIIPATDMIKRYKQMMQMSVM
jgi:hypothetical protein